MITIRILLAAVFISAGCSRSGPVGDIERTGEEKGYPSQRLDASSAERFGYDRSRVEGSGTAMPVNRSAAESGLAEGSGTTPVAGSEQNASGLAWTAPEGWTVGPEKPMRAVTLLSGPDQSVECYITVLPGDAGGAAANLNRWCGQMGHPAMTDEVIAGLPKLTCLGQPAPLLELRGTYQGMRGPERPGSLFLGTLATANGNSIFVKMVGPAEDVQREREHFIAFCESLRAADA